MSDTLLMSATWSPSCYSSWIFFFFWKGDWIIKLESDFLYCMLCLILLEGK